MSPVEAVAEGVPLIAENAENLEAAARRLFSTEECRVSDIIRGFAAEEAAKVLIVLDAVRCPEEHREETLKCFEARQERHSACGGSVRSTRTRPEGIALLISTKGTALSPLVRAEIPVAEASSTTNYPAALLVGVRLPMVRPDVMDGKSASWPKAGPLTPSRKGRKLCCPGATRKTRS